MGWRHAIHLCSLWWFYGARMSSRTRPKEIFGVLFIIQFRSQHRLFYLLLFCFSVLSVYVCHPLSVLALFGFFAFPCFFFHFCAFQWVPYALYSYNPILRPVQGRLVRCSSLPRLGLTLESNPMESCTSQDV